MLPGLQYLDTHTSGGMVSQMCSHGGVAQIGPHNSSMVAFVVQT